MTEPSSSAVKRYKTVYKKQPGTLSITSAQLTWVADQAGAERLGIQQLSRIASMFTSKAGAAKTSAKITFINDVPAGGLTFQFVAPSPQDVADRQELQETLVPVIARNKEREAEGLAAGSNVAQGIGAGSAAIAESSTSGNRSRGDTPASGGAGTGTNTPNIVAGRKKAMPAGFSEEEIALKTKVLTKHPTLRKLHAELVFGKLVTDAEFWEGRQHLIEQERLLSTQKAGPSSQLLDDRFNLSLSNKNKADANKVTGGTGLGIAQPLKRKERAGEEEVKIQVTRELMEEVFREFPVVQDIYAEHVGSKQDQMSEQDFWSRYFRSKLWDRHRASARAGGHTVARADPIFDQYLTAVDDDVEPRNAPSRSVDMFLDLAATEEDHMDSGNIRDVTMQAGKQRATIPLIRRFNEHSNRLVALDEEDAANDVTDGQINTAEQRLLSEIELDDLQGYNESTTIALDVQERQNVFDGKSRAGKGEEEEDRSGLGKMSTADLRNLLLQSHTSLLSYNPDLPSIIPALPADAELQKKSKESWINREGASMAEFSRLRKEGEKALGVVVKGIEERREGSREQEPLPQAIMSQILTCHNAHTEFLRQFWSAILPPAPAANNNANSLGGLKPEQRAAKARKMVGFLEGMRGKVEGVVRSAEEMKGNGEEVDVRRVQEALAPTLATAEKALAQYAAMGRR